MRTAEITGSPDPLRLRIAIGNRDRFACGESLAPFLGSETFVTPLVVCFWLPRRFGGNYEVIAGGPGVLVPRAQTQAGAGPN